MAEWQKVELADSHDFSKEKKFTGVYIGKETNVGPNKSNLYKFKKDGKTISIWGSTVIDARMADIELGHEVMIVSLGDATSPSTGRTYSNYELFSRPLESSLGSNVEPSEMGDLDGNE